MGFEPMRRYQRPTPFPGEPLRPAWVLLQMAEIKRRGWDSNPRALADKRFSRPPRYDHFDTSPDFSHSVSLTLAVRKSLYQVFTALSIDFLDFLKKFFNRHCVISVLFEPLTSATCFILSRSPVVVNIFFYIFCIFSPITFQAHSPL